MEFSNFRADLFIYLFFSFLVKPLFGSLETSETFFKQISKWLVKTVFDNFYELINKTALDSFCKWIVKIDLVSFHKGNVDTILDSFINELLTLFFRNGFLFYIFFFLSGILRTRSVFFYSPLILLSLAKKVKEN